MVVGVLCPGNHVRSGWLPTWVTGRTYGDFIVLPHWEIRLSTPLPAIPLSYIIPTLSHQSLPYPNNADRLARRQWLIQCQDNVTMGYQVMMPTAWSPSWAVLYIHSEWALSQNRYLSLI